MPLLLWQSLLRLLIAEAATEQTVWVNMAVPAQAVIAHRRPEPELAVCARCDMHMLLTPRCHDALPSTSWCSLAMLSMGLASPSDKPFPWAALTACPCRGVLTSSRPGKPERAP